MATSSKIVIELQGVGRILLNKNIGVPIYQRCYAWEEEHVDDLFSDISRAIAEGDAEYFIGSIVTTKNQGNRTEVADGQQRLATLTILLAAVRDYFHLNGDTKRANKITGDYLNTEDLKTLKMIPKLRLNDIDNDYFMKRVLSLPDEAQGSIKPERPSHLRINRAAQKAGKFLERTISSGNPTDVLTDMVNYIQDAVKVIWVQVPDDANAFMIFETLNDRGLTLAISDLLKNHLYGLAGHRIGEVQQAWTSMLTALDALGEENVLLVFLRHYWSSVHGLVREKDLYASIKRRVYNETTAVDFSKKVAKNAQVYAAIMNPADSFWAKYGETSRRHAETISLLRMVQVRPLILSVLSTFTDSETAKAIKNIVSWSVRFLIHGGTGSGALEASYCEAAKEVRAGKIINSSQLYEQMKILVPNDEQFKQAFCDVSVSKSYLARYYLRALELQERGEPEPELVPNDNKEAVNLEHILPVNPSEAWKHIPTDEKALLINRLGNMALMKTKANEKTGNDGFASKKKRYRRSDFKLTAELAKIGKWDRSGVEARQAHMAGLAVIVWPLK